MSQCQCGGIPKSKTQEGGGDGGGGTERDGH